MGTTIAVVASGAMGAGVAARLTSHGAHVLTSLAGRSEASQDRARRAGMHDAPLGELAGADLFLSIVPPDRAWPLAREMAAVLQARPGKAIYVDLNAVSPDTARAVASAVEASGACFVDGGIIGGPPAGDAKGPTIYLSGQSAAAAALLAAHGLVVKQLEGGIGAASALKMSYAGITKGITALAACMALAAERAGVGAALREELATSQAQLLARFSSAVPDMFPKAYRWVPEMREIEHFIGAERPESQILKGASDLYIRLAADFAGERTDMAALAAAFAAE